MADPEGSGISFEWLRNVFDDPKLGILFAAGIEAARASVHHRIARQRYERAFLSPVSLHTARRNRGNLDLDSEGHQRRHMHQLECHQIPSQERSQRNWRDARYWLYLASVMGGMSLALHTKDATHIEMLFDQFRQDGGPVEQADVFDKQIEQTENAFRLFYELLPALPGPFSTAVEMLRIQRLGRSRQRYAIALDDVVALGNLHYANNQLESAVKQCWSAIVTPGSAKTVQEVTAEIRNAVLPHLHNIDHGIGIKPPDEARVAKWMNPRNAAQLRRYADAASRFHDTDMAYRQLTGRTDDEGRDAHSYYASFGTDLLKCVVNRAAAKRNLTSVADVAKRTAAPLFGVSAKQVTFAHMDALVEVAMQTGLDQVARTSLLG